MDNNQDDFSTKQRIIQCAVDLFAVKGYTETSIRDLANAVGLKGASIYNHFPSKNAILEYILDDYSQHLTTEYMNKNIDAILLENPTSDGILASMQLTFPKGLEEYYLKVLHVLMQEQYRNPIVRSYMSKDFILHNELNIKVVLDVLKKLKVIREDTDPDYWMKTVSSLVYTFASRSMLGIGDSTPDFSGMGLMELLKLTFDNMLKTCSFKN